MKKNKLSELYAKYKEVIMYLVFGVATTVISFAVYSLCVAALSLEMTLSNAISWVCAVTFAYVTNKIFVFMSKNTSPAVLIREIISFFGSRAVTGVIEIVFPTLLFKLGVNFDLFGIQGFTAKAIVSVVVIVLNYVFSKFLIFRKKDAK